MGLVKKHQNALATTAAQPSAPHAKTSSEPPVGSAITLGREGYKFRDLVKIGLVTSRDDLMKKQRKYGFPLPIKIGSRSAWWPRSMLEAWLNERAALPSPPPPARRQEAGAQA